MPHSDNRHGQFVRLYLTCDFLLCTSTTFEFVPKNILLSCRIRHAIDGEIRAGQIGGGH
jgi:hypothetical protein